VFTRRTNEEIEQLMSEVRMDTDRGEEFADGIYQMGMWLYYGGPRPKNYHPAEPIQPANGRARGAHTYARLTRRANAGDQAAARALNPPLALVKDGPGWPVVGENPVPELPPGSRRATPEDYETLEDPP